ncbi:hypothetical protein B0T16DRAFT_456673 [Cercophora newfieldiana]|uniref:Uncharacterized protein n=1 Tax=Cercophora newfieldiana TaxID=92897 RepID=A0AA39YAW6_9PEZI|nr:hypothetical protein B0T16DRAFT_456673 [Cercophora newfieldiana]
MRLLVAELDREVKDVNWTIDMLLDTYGVEKRELQDKMKLTGVRRLFADALARTQIIRRSIEIEAASKHVGVKSLSRAGPGLEELVWVFDPRIQALKRELDAYEAQMDEVEIQHVEDIAALEDGEGTLREDKDCLDRMHEIIKRVESLDEKQLIDGVLGRLKKREAKVGDKFITEVMRMRLRR